MLKQKLQNASESKLTKTLNKLSKDDHLQNTGFITKPDKTSLLKTKSFRLRELDLQNLNKIKSYINEHEERRCFSDSQIIRGLINYFANDIEGNFKKTINYIRSAS